MREMLLIVIVMVLTSTALGQTLQKRHIPKTQQEMHAQVVALYSFHPMQISDTERKAKSQEMDLFWGDIKGSTEITLPLLRTELSNPSNPSFFFMDGTELLLSLSKTREDKQLAANTLPRVDLHDTQSGSYFYAVHNLASDGVDVTAAALHTLDKATFAVPVPQHAMTLDRRMALMYLLLSMDEKLWMTAAEQRFAIEKDTDAKKALLNSFFYVETDEGDRMLGKVAKGPSQPEGVRKEAQDFLKNNESAKTWLPVSGSVADLREKRRQRLRAVSDEAIDDVEGMTKKIAQLRAKGEK